MLKEKGTEGDGWMDVEEVGAHIGWRVLFVLIQHRRRATGQGLAGNHSLFPFWVIYARIAVGSDGVSMSSR